MIKARTSGVGKRIMAFGDDIDSNVDATDPDALLKALGTDSLNGAIIAARILADGPPPTMTTGMAPDGHLNGDKVCTIEQSPLAQSMLAQLPEPAQLPGILAAASGAFKPADLAAAPVPAPSWSLKS